MIKNLSRTTSSVTYTPYGFCHLRCAAATLGFNGQKMDPHTNSYSLGNGHRYYSAALMRFLAPDALSPFNEGGLNTYVYCGADPVNLIDPGGQSPQSKIPVLKKGHSFVTRSQRQYSLTKSKIPRPVKSSPAPVIVQEWHWDDPELGRPSPQSLEWDYPHAPLNNFKELLWRNRHTYKIVEQLSTANLHLGLMEEDLKKFQSFSIQASDENSHYIHNLSAISKMQVVLGAVEEIRGPISHLSIYGILGRFHNS